MHSTTVRAVIATAAAVTAAFTLIGCADDVDLDHGKVIEKRSRSAQGPIYEKVQRPAPCRATRTQTLRSSLTKPAPPKPAPPKPAPPKPAPVKPAPVKPAPVPDGPQSKDKTTPRTPEKGDGRRPCGTVTIPVLKGYKTPGKWELKLQDGKETDWETVTYEEYNSVAVGDSF
ncbi:hypothetical protein OG413_44930 [Streptomyces sp. NBC_01433]|uniref:hypothetical protein n=1 Tax=Streptomyces sp. NBC_01433 TaxID=2903864 RepID=UPI002256AAE6|nr:hypothetical protein [Streptomyces sp. NBC_01433]MCX4682331.1 hypothetical protein [Streptomyces sp. NBC_01433]